jgi:predicted porin
MKRLLYGTTALVAAGTLMAGPANAAGFEASLNGYMEQWFGFADSDIDGTGAGSLQDIGTNSDTEVHFNAVATLDNGLKVQYHVELEGNTTGDQIDESYLRTTASWGQIVMGSENSASYLMAYGPNDFGITANSGDIGNWVPMPGKAGLFFRFPMASRNNEVDPSCNDDNRLTYFTPRFSGFQFGLSYTPNCGGGVDVGGDGGTGGLATTAGGIHDVISLGANFQRKFDQVELGLAVTYSFGEEPAGNVGSDPETFHVGGNIGFGGFSLGASYNENFSAINVGGVSNEAWGFQGGVSYETGPWHFSVIYLHGERDGFVAAPGDDELDSIHLAANYDLGPGVTLAGTIGWADYKDEAGALDNEGWFIVGGMKLAF